MQWLLLEGGAAMSEVNSDGDGVWQYVTLSVNEANDAFPLPAVVTLADTYSILRCYASPPVDAAVFLAGLDPLPAAHR